MNTINARVRVYGKAPIESTWPIKNNPIVSQAVIAIIDCALKITPKLSCIFLKMIENTLDGEMKNYFPLMVLKKQECVFGQW